MAKIKHYIDKDSGQITRQTKVGNKVEYETISKDQLENYEAGQSIWGCLGYVIMFFIIVKLFLM